MKQYTKQMLLFKDIFGKKVEIDFNGYDVTTDWITFSSRS